jgi:hypothetical protein
MYPAACALRPRRVPEAQKSLILNGPPGSEIGKHGSDSPDKGDDARLFKLALMIPKKRRFSRIEHGVPALLDQILVLVELFPADGDGKRLLPESDVHVDFRYRLPSAWDDPSACEVDVAPDHAPVTTTFDL